MTAPPAGALDGTHDDADLAASLAAEAGRLLLDVRAAHPDLVGSRALKDLGDARAQELLGARLAQERGGDAVLSEEAVDSPERLTADRVWIVDPLDGTREYSEGRHDWAVHVALWARGELTAGAVALPALGLTLGTAEPVTPAPPAGDGPARFAVSRSRASALVVEVAAACGGELLAMGSAGYKTAAVVRGEADVYLHSGGQYEWDNAAPVAVARAAGLHASRLDGSPLHYNRADPTQPDLLVCRPDRAEHILTEVVRARARLADRNEPPTRT